MKKLLIGTLFIGLASLGFSQSSNDVMEEVKLSDVAVTPNQAYLDKVRDGTISYRVFTLEKKASRYTIKESPFYNGSGGLHKIKFAQKIGNILATYDPKGKILSTSERYKNVMLPKAVRNRVYTEYPGWKMEDNAYLVSYHHKKGTKKMYKIQVRKDRLKKNLKIDAEGNLL